MGGGTPIPPLGPSPCRPLGITPGTTQKEEKLPPMGHGMDSMHAWYRAYHGGGRSAALEMVTLDGLCGLCGPTGKWVGGMGAARSGLDSTEV